MHVLFIELQGDGAAERLRELQRELDARAEVTHSELLAGADQPGLYLLVCRGRTRPAFAPPPGARIWSFAPATSSP
ncbi:MAG TPA: hypothetical protein VF171_00175 [Trueperaceae bacterium]